MKQLKPISLRLYEELPFTQQFYVELHHQLKVWIMPYINPLGRGLNLRNILKNDIS